jgi:hypothetical protein
MQLVRKANATRSVVAAILDMLLFGIYQRMNASVRFDNQKDLERIESRRLIFHRQWRFAPEQDWVWRRSILNQAGSIERRRRRQGLPSSQIRTAAYLTDAPANCGLFGGRRRVFGRSDFHFLFKLPP